LSVVVSAELARFLSVVGKEIGKSGAMVGPASLAADIVGWNSAAMVNILFAVEDAYGVEFTSEQMERVDGVPILLAIFAEAGGVLAPT
jgi:hypothetical protein